MEATIIERSAAANPVVQNDTAVKVSTTTQAAAIGLAALEDKRKQWEATVYRTSNQQLYALLAECLAYGGELSFEQAQQRSQVLADFCQVRGYAVKKDSPLLTRIVKAVFGNVDRRRISTYSLVLRSAKAANVLPTDLAQWIEQNGGVQEIKLARSASYISPKAKAEKVQATLSSAGDLAVVKTEALAQLADADHMGQECVLVAVQQADGSFAVKALTRSGTAITAALQSVYGQQAAANK